MSHPSRRTALGLMLAAPLVARGQFPKPANAKYGHFKLSLAAYSFRKFLDLKKPPKDPMTLAKFADFAAACDLGAIEVTSYYVPETTPAWLQGFKRHCTRLGLDISGMATNNDFCQADAGKRANDVKKVKEWIAVSAFLGAKTLRVFAGKTPKGDTEAAALKRCIECFKEVADAGGKHGIVLAVENHHGITSTPDQLQAIVDGVKHEWFGVNLDTGNFHTADPYGDLAKVAKYAVVVQMKTEVFPSEKKEEADIPRLFNLLHQAEYRGYVALEYEAAEDPHTAVPRYLREMKKYVT